MRSLTAFSVFVFMTALINNPFVPVSGMPDFRTVKASAFSADKLWSKNIHTAVPAFSWLPSLHLSLYRIKHFRSDDAFMTALHIVHRDFTVIDFLLFCQIISSIGLLQEGITFIFLIGQNAFYGTAVPFFFSGRCPDALFCQLFGNRMRCQPCQEQAVNFPHSFCFRLIDDHFSVWSSVVSKKTSERNIRLSVRHALPLSPYYIFRNGTGFFLCEARHNGD